MPTVPALVVQLEIRVLAEKQLATRLEAIAPEFVVGKPVEHFIVAVEIGHETPVFGRPTVFKPQPRAPWVA